MSLKGLGLSRSYFTNHLLGSQLEAWTRTRPLRQEMPSVPALVPGGGNLASPIATSGVLQGLGKDGICGSLSSLLESQSLDYEPTPDNRQAQQDKSAEELRSAEAGRTRARPVVLRVRGLLLPPRRRTLPAQGLLPQRRSRISTW